MALRKMLGQRSNKQEFKKCQDLNHLRNYWEDKSECLTDIG